MKYYVLLPSVSLVGTSLDTVQWESILRSVSAATAYRQVHGNDPHARTIADFLIFDGRMPRSLAFCRSKINGNLAYLAAEYGTRSDSQNLSESLSLRMAEESIDTVFEYGLHQFIQDFIRDNNSLSADIEKDFRFNG